jgi:hypothetical protein
MSHAPAEYDEIMQVLMQCELKLRLLQEQGRLTMDGLREFVELSTRVRAEIDRRQLADRRATLRQSPDRRVTAGAVQQVSVEPV